MLVLQVCEHVVDVLNSGNPVPPPLLARMLKYKVLKQKMFDKAEANLKVNLHAYACIYNMYIYKKSTTNEVYNSIKKKKKKKYAYSKIKI